MRPAALLVVFCAATQVVAFLPTRPLPVSLRQTHHCGSRSGGCVSVLRRIRPLHSASASDSSSSTETDAKKTPKPWMSMSVAEKREWKAEQEKANGIEPEKGHKYDFQNFMKQK